MRSDERREFDDDDDGVVTMGEKGFLVFTIASGPAPFVFSLSFPELSHAADFDPVYFDGSSFLPSVRLPFWGLREESNGFYMNPISPRFLARLTAVLCVCVSAGCSFKYPSARSLMRVREKVPRQIYKEEK